MFKKNELMPMKLTSDMQTVLSRGAAQGVLKIAPVHVPSPNTGNCNHFGWPIATITGGTLVVMHRRIPGHNKRHAGRPDKTMSYGVVLRSEDGGETWSEPYDMRDAMNPEDRKRGGLVPLSHRYKFDPENTSAEGYKVHLHAIGTTRDGAIVAMNNHGVFRSEDAGRTWRHFSTALRDDTFPHPIVNVGPRIIDSPSSGLLAFGNWFGKNEKKLISDGLPRQLVILKSEDGGASWQAEDFPAGFPQYEPAALLHEDRFLFVIRDQADTAPHIRSNKQMVWQPGMPPRVIDSNLENPRSVDTVDLSFNPVTRRFEMVRSERCRMELWLWSLAPEAWESGVWRRECRLLAMEGEFYKSADGFHPAGAVIDEKRGVQHIFVYAGYPGGPAGVFHIRRTLDTEALRRALSDAEEFRTNGDNKHEIA